MGFFLVVVCRLSCPEACEILVSWPGIKPTSPASEGRFLKSGIGARGWARQHLYFWLVKEDLQSQKRFDLPQSDHDFNTVLDTKTDSRFHKTSSNSSSSQSKQLPPQYLTFLKTTTKTSKRNKNVLREESYSPCCIITTTSASSSQKIWAELAGVPHRCYAFTFVDVNAPRQQWMHNWMRVAPVVLKLAKQWNSVKQTLFRTSTYKR